MLYVCQRCEELQELAADGGSLDDFQEFIEDHEVEEWCDTCLDFRLFVPADQ